MANLCIDSSAWIEYLDGTARGEKVGKLIEDGGNSVHSSTVVLAEVASKLARSGKDPQTAYNAIIHLSRVMPFDAESAREAGVLHARMRKTMPNFALADAVVIVCAQRSNAKIVTLDNHFKNVPGAIIL